MKRFVLLAVLAFALMGQVFAGSSPEQVKGHEAETLTLTPGSTTSEINITWYGNTADGASGAVKFSTQKSLKSGAFPANAQTVTATGIDATTGKVSHKATLTGLAPNTEYAYSVSSDGVNFSKSYVYKTPPAGKFTFAAVGDPQLTEEGISPTAEGVPGGFQENNNSKTTRQGWQETIDLIMKLKPAFIAGVGDQIDRNLVSELGAPEASSDPHEKKYDNFFAPSALRSVPFAPVVGNHEGRSGYGFVYHYNPPNEQNFTPVNTGRSGSRHEMESKGNYFYLYNNVLFVALGTASYPRNKEEAEQVITGHFVETLKAATTQYSGKYDWLFVQTHKTIAGLADHAADEDIQYFVEAGFEQLMDTYKVDFVLSGHDHIYARSFPMNNGKRVAGKEGNKISNAGGTVYFTLNSSSGQKFYENFVPGVTDNTEYPYLADGSKGSAELMSGKLPYNVNLFHQDKKPMFMSVDVNGRAVSFKVYEVQDNLSTKVIDTYTVSK